MTDEAGKDATDAFEDVGHSDDARNQLEKLYIGELQGGTSKVSLCINLFRNEANKRQGYDDICCGNTQDNEE